MIGQDKQANIQQQLRSMRRVVVVLVTLSVVILLGLLIFVPIDERIDAKGIVSSERDTHLYAPEDGTLKSIEAHEGERVKKGQAVLRLDDTHHQAELQQIQASIEKARSELAFQKARLERTAKLPLPKEFWHMQEELGIARERIHQSSSEFQRASDLHAKGLLSQQDVERAGFNLEVAKSEEAKSQDKLRILGQGLESTILTEAGAEYQNAHTALQALEVQRKLRLESIERGILRSPEDGIVTLINKRRSGEKVTLGEDLAHVAHGATTRVDVFAGESQYHRVQPGQRVLMKSKSFDTLRQGYIEGRVVRVSMEPESTDASGEPVFRVVTHIEQSPIELVIGSTVEARIILQRIPLWKLLLPETLRH